MKKLLKVVSTVVAIVAILAVAKTTVKANEDAIANENQMDSVVVEDKNSNDINDDGNYKTEDNEGQQDTFTYRLIVDKIDYLSFRKGHDGDYTLVYSVNGGENHTVIMGMLGLELFNCVPTYISHYYDIADVKVGDVITYTYSYYNTYFQEKEPSVVKGSKVVDKAYYPDDAEILK